MPRSKSIKPDPDSIALEYNALRSEILKRIELRQQVMAITLTLAGVFLSVGLTTDTVALIYPPLAAFLAMAWAQNDYRIRDIATYIRLQLEANLPGLNYETYVQEMRRTRKDPSGWRFVVISHSGIFLITQIMAVGLDIAIELIRSGRFPPNPLQWILLSLDLVSIAVVIVLARYSGR